MTLRFEIETIFMITISAIMRQEIFHLMRLFHINRHLFLATKTKLKTFKIALIFYFVLNESTGMVCCIAEMGEQFGR